MNLEKMKDRVEKIKRELLEVGEMRPGSINSQMTVCGQPICKCKDPKKPQKHGPYYQLSYVHQGKSTTQFIQKELEPGVQIQLKNFKTFKALTLEWVDLALQIAKETLAADKERLKKVAKKGSK